MLTTPIFVMPVSVLFLFLKFSQIFLVLPILDTFLLSNSIICYIRKWLNSAIPIISSEKLMPLLNLKSKLFKKSFAMQSIMLSSEQSTISPVRVSFIFYSFFLNYSQGLTLLLCSHNFFFTSIKVLETLQIKYFFCLWNVAHC